MNDLAICEQQRVGRLHDSSGTLFRLRTSKADSLELRRHGDRSYLLLEDKLMRAGRQGHLWRKISIPCFRARRNCNEPRLPGNSVIWSSESGIGCNCGRMDQHTKIDDQKHPLTMRYNDFAFTSVSTRISLQRKAESLRPLFDFVRIPSLNNFLIPILRVGAVRSKRLFAS